MYQYQYSYQYPYYNVQPSVADNLTQLRMNANQMQNPVVQPSMASQPMQTQPNNGLIWVQGESGAKSYLVAPNTTVMLMDSEGERFYLKSADASGMPLPLRIFDYKERSVVGSQPVSSPTIENSINYDNFVTRKEFDELKASIASKTTPKKSKNNLTEDAENE